LKTLFFSTKSAADLLWVNQIAYGGSKDPAGKVLTKDPINWIPQGTGGGAGNTGWLICLSNAPETSTTVTTKTSTITATTTTTKSTTTTTTTTRTTETSTSSTNTGFVSTPTETVVIVDNALDYDALSNSEKTILEPKLIQLVADLPFVGYHSIHHIVLSRGGISALDGQGTSLGTTATVVMMPRLKDVGDRETLATAAAAALTIRYSGSGTSIPLGEHTFVVDSNSAFFASSSAVQMLKVTTPTTSTTVPPPTVAAAAADELEGAAMGIVIVAGIIAFGLIIAMVYVWLQIPHGELEFHEMKFLAGEVNPDLKETYAAASNNIVLSNWQAGGDGYASPVPTDMGSGGMDGFPGMVTSHLPGASPSRSSVGFETHYNTQM
jgi:hypothetical protein